MNPPHTRREAVVDTLHGVDVADPYRWLEDGDDAEVQRWVAQQNRNTRAALDALPSREVWHERLVALMGLAIVQAVQVRGDTAVVLHRPAGAQQAQLVAVARADLGRLESAVVIADPSSSTDDAAAAVDWFELSPDGKLVAFGVSEGGTEQSVLRVARCSDGSLLADEIPDCRACSIAWDPDGGGFAYTRYPVGDQYHRTVHQHRLGQPWRDDPVVWAAHVTPETWPNVAGSPGGRWLLVEAMVGWGRTDLHLLDRLSGEWRTVITGVDAVNEGWTFADERWLVGTTTLQAPFGRVVRVDLHADLVGPAQWQTVLAEGDEVLGVAVCVDGGVFVPSSRVGVDRVRFVAGSGESVDLALGLRSLLGLGRDGQGSSALAVIQGFDLPPSIVRLTSDGDVESVSAAADTSQVALTVEHVHYPSLDATEIPIFLIASQGAVTDQATPTILNGYGGFALAETPLWSPTIAAWCSAGGQYAIAGLRGGTEYGEAWHHAGRRNHKQNVFDDFHAAADWLVSTGRTSRRRLAIAGGSNGGLLVGAALTQRPDLCRAVWCAVPLLDMIRFPQFLIARLWTDEYGDPDIAEQFGWLHAYSPYHHVTAGERYPAVLLTTAEGDTRVDPLHARKMAALLQACALEQDERPILLHQEGRAGHGVGKPVGKKAAEQADVLAFFSWQLGLDQAG